MANETLATIIGSNPVTSPAGTEAVYLAQNPAGTASDAGITMANVKAYALATSTLTGHPTIEGVQSTGATGTGLLVFGTRPTLIAPAIGTPASGSLANCTGITSSIEFVIDGGGSVITTGLRGPLEVPVACSITRATTLGDQTTGSVVVDVWKTTYSSYRPGVHPVSSDSITSASPPTISTAAKAQDTTLSGWTTALSGGDLLAFNVSSIATFTKVTVSLLVTT